MTALPVIEGGKTARVREQHIACRGGEPEEQVGHRHGGESCGEGKLAEDEDRPAGQHDAVEAEPAGENPGGRRAYRRPAAHKQQHVSRRDLRKPHHVEEVGARPEALHPEQSPDREEAERRDLPEPRVREDLEKALGGHPVLDARQRIPGGTFRVRKKIAAALATTAPDPQKNTERHPKSSLT
ncbi:MAG: hypothetical protein M3P37_03260 [Actinomycetota bacterium]|nr:hypothetical protein [Actinomycetota bacterium]